MKTIDTTQGILILCAISLAACTIVSVLLYTIAPPQIPLWHSLAVAEQQLAPREYLALFPVAQLACTLLNAAIVTNKKLFPDSARDLFVVMIVLPLILLWIGLWRVLTVLV